MRKNKELPKLNKNIDSKTNVIPDKLNAKIKASPLVKKIAKDQNIELTKITGSGPEGRIIKRDIELNTATQESPNQIINKDAIVPSMMRKVIAKRTLEAKQQIPHFYLTIESNVDKLIDLT